MWRRAHLYVGVGGIIAFLATGMIMHTHTPPMEELNAELRLMYVSRHLYILSGALVNLMLGLYLTHHSNPRRRIAQHVGSAMLLAAPLWLVLAFAVEPGVGRTWRSTLGLYVRPNPQREAARKTPARTGCIVGES